MTSAHTLEQHLRYLRRYASILTGSKTSGDNLILACLEGLAESGDHLRNPFGRVQLFSRFHDTVDRMGYVYDPSLWRQIDPEETRTLMRLASLDGLDRAILLLRKVERFSDETIATILGLPEDEIGLRLVNASKTMMGLEHHSVLIMEDEYLIARDLWRIVEEMGHCVCGVAGSAQAAVAMAARVKPSLLLADLRLEDGQFGGINAAKEITSDANIPVVFVTAYPEKATRDALHEPFIVRKPFHPGTIANAVNRALARHLQGPR